MKRSTAWQVSTMARTTREDHVTRFLISTFQNGGFNRLDTSVHYQLPKNTLLFLAYKLWKTFSTHINELEKQIYKNR